MTIWTSPPRRRRWWWSCPRLSLSPTTRWWTWVPPSASPVWSTRTQVTVFVSLSLCVSSSLSISRPLSLYFLLSLSLSLSLYSILSITLCLSFSLSVSVFPSLSTSLPPRKRLWWCRPRSSLFLAVSLYSLSPFKYLFLFKYIVYKNIYIDKNWLTLSVSLSFYPSLSLYLNDISSLSIAV